MTEGGADGDRGYDPTIREPYPTERPLFVETLPPATIVNPAFLPPVGQQTLASGRALCYGTRLFADWKDYNGGEAPYWGNGQLIMSKKSGKPVGHCMLIIGYSDPIGALLIQNSEGRVWGIAGYVWMAYSTFQFLAQGQTFFIKD